MSIKKTLLITISGIILLSGLAVSAVNYKISSSDKVVGDGFYNILENPTLGSLSDVDTTLASVDDILIYDGSDWIAEINPGGSGGGGSSIWSTTTPDLIYYYNGFRDLIIGGNATTTEVNNNLEVIGGLYTDEATTTGFTINGERFTDFTGTGLSNVGGVLTASGGSGDLVSTNNLSDVSSSVLSAHNLFDDSIFAVETVVPADKILMKDVSGSNVLKTVTAQSIADLYSGVTYESDPTWIASSSNYYTKAEADAADDYEADTNTQLSDGDIGAFGYIKDYTESDPIWMAASSSYATFDDISDLGGGDMVEANYDTEAEFESRLFAVTVPTELTAGLETQDTCAEISGCVVGAITTDTNTQLSQEQVEDYVGGMTSGTETNISVTYNDTTGNLNYVVTDAWYNSLDDLKAAVSNDFHNLGGTDANTTYLGGTNLTLSGTTFNVDNPVVANLTGVASGNLVTADINTYSELNTIVADQTLAYGGGAFHDGFSDFVANEHTDWRLTTQGTIHATNYVDNNTTYVAGDFAHDSLASIPVNDHLDWTLDLGATNIHAGNYTDTNTTYTAGGTLLDLTTGTFSVNEGTLTDTKLCTYEVATGLNCNHTDADTTYLGGTSLTLDGSTFNVDDDFLLNTGDTATGNYNFDSNTLVVDSTNDRVGVGIASPLARLHVNYPTSGDVIFQAGTGDGGSDMNFQYGYNGYGWYNRYLGSGGGNGNEWQLWSEGAGATDMQVYGITQDGNITFKHNVTVDGTLTGDLTGNSTTATALAANGTNCSAGNYPLGVDASGNAESCTAVSGGSGTVTSVGMTTPTGLTVSGSPITSAGTLAVALTAGYIIPTTVKTGQWDTAYGWGDWNGNIDISTDTNLAVTSPIVLTGDTLSLSQTSITSLGTITTGTWNATAIDFSSYTNATGGTSITLTGDSINVDDDFIKNNASDTMAGTLTADGLTLGANENITLGDKTLDHDGTDFNFNDSVDINDGTHGLRIVPGTSTTTLNFY